MFNRNVLAALGIATFFSVTAQADVLPGPGLYALENHPDGSAASPLYGLRLDELFDVSDGHDVFTFDFEDADSEMLLDYDGESIHIYGTTVGGLDEGSSYADEYFGLWAVDFTFHMTELAAGDDDLAVTTPDYFNTGSITRLETGDVIPLYDYSGSNAYTFRLGDEDNDLGHRGFDGISGWGWINHTSPDAHVAASDWLFTVNPNPIPEPGIGLICAVGAAAIAGRRRRR